MGESCGDVSTCTWSVDDGTVSPSSGSPVSYTAPETLEDCRTIEAVLRVECADAGTSEVAIITVECTPAMEQALNGGVPEGTEVGGGGCGSPGWTLVFMPLAALRRRPRLAPEAVA